jgi:hypothetical protein
MLASSHHYAEIKHFEDHGIELTGEVKVNLEKWLLVSKPLTIRWSKIFDG